MGNPLVLPKLGIARLDKDVNTVHPDGRPVYLTARDWNGVQYQRTHGDTYSADQYDAFARRRFLARQHEP